MRKRSIAILLYGVPWPGILRNAASYAVNASSGRFVRASTSPRITSARKCLGSLARTERQSVSSFGERTAPAATR